MARILTIPLALCFLTSCSAPSEVIITVIGTSDIHGALLLQADGSGLASFSGYVNAAREARQEDGGALLLIDAGDMWQGTLESNLSEGASTVEAYNALGYTAAAVGNHEFDFGPVGPLPIPGTAADDPRGALKQRATEARFPFLAANLIDDSTGNPVQWPNVQPSVLIDVAGVKVGIIGVMTEAALASSIAANTMGLSIAPLVDSIEREARNLRQAGATIVLVTAHAGGGCREFDDAFDTSSCDLSSEIFVVAENLPNALVDHIVAGHTHKGIAHVVNDISISQAYSRARSFGRVDLTVDRKTGQLTGRKVFPPTTIAAKARYEGRNITPDVAISAIVDRAAESARDKKNREIGIYLETPFELTLSPESPLGNLYTEGLLAATDADISMHRTNTSIRADLPAGELSFGSLFEMSPFDNQITVIELSGRELRQVIAEQAHEGRFRVGFSGMRVQVACSTNNMTINMTLNTGHEIADEDTVTAAVVNYLALGGDGVFESVMPEGGYSLQASAPLARDAIADWLQQRGGSISERDFSSDETPKWSLSQDMDKECRLNY
jgi:2',3'-cyclic-nucleotide 2'-phosphodiesterase (5'-nucleotidase family)